MAANEQGVQSASGMQSVTVNMVSDVVCPWCIVGYQRLQEAIKTLDNIEVDIKFHPFELNPNMPEEDGLIETTSRYIRVPESARIYIRAICARFDAYLNASEILSSYSKAI